MNTIIDQSLFDVAIQEDGSVLSTFEWAIKNGLSITDNLEPGQKLSTPISVFRNDEVARYFTGKRQMIATAKIDNIEIISPQLGIGSMIIETNFIVQ